MICEEMKKLRDYLESHGIDWIDNSDEFENGDYICRTYFFKDGSRISVINGCGTYGGYYHDSDNNEGLLEMMTGLLDGDPIGRLTSDDIIQFYESGTVPKPHPGFNSLEEFITKLIANHKIQKGGE